MARLDLLDPLDKMDALDPQDLLEPEVSLELWDSLAPREPLERAESPVREV